MSNQTRRRSRLSRHGFTLVEMLVVIGIIIILIGILVPVIGVVRTKGFETDTRAEVNRIATAAQAYYADFRAYPGPVPESMISPPITGGTPPPAIGGLTGGANVTSSENLVLGLIGGLKNVAGTISFDPSLVTKGPQSLNPGAPKQYSAYIEATPSDLTPFATPLATPPTYDTYNNYAKGVIGTPPNPSDTNVPEFFDHYPTPHAIIYLRARVGAQYACDKSTGTAKPTNSQYYPDQMAPYWMGGNTVKADGTPVYMPGATTMFPTVPDKNNNLVPLWTRAPLFFQSPSIQDQGITPRGKDAFILISAGADGIYGTKDDVIFSN